MGWMGAFWSPPPSGTRTLPGPGAVMRALRRGREAVTDIDGDLDTVLDWLQDPSAPLDAAVPDRLAQRARDADEALGTLTPVRELASHSIF
jgi:hypothetical protein